MNDLRRCIKCDGPTRPGRFRCDTCQFAFHTRPALRLVTLPGADASDVRAESMRRHPAGQSPDRVPPGA